MHLNGFLWAEGIILLQFSLFLVDKWLKNIDYVFLLFFALQLWTSKLNLCHPIKHNDLFPMSKVFNQLWHWDKKPTTTTDQFFLWPDNNNDRKNDNVSNVYGNEMVMGRVNKCWSPSAPTIWVYSVHCFKRTKINLKGPFKEHQWPILQTFYDRNLRV